MIKKFLLVGLVAVPTVAAVAALFALGAMYQRVRAFDRQNRCDVLAGLTAEDLLRRQAEAGSATNVTVSAATNAAVVEAASEAANEAKDVALRVERVDYDGVGDVRVVFSERPDMDVVRRYVKVEPLREGSVGFRYETRYNFKKEVFEPVLCVSGEFAYRTNVTLRVLKGFPLYGKGADPKAGGALAQDFAFTFNRKDPEPAVKFADDGRYLPPGGGRALRLEAVGITNLATSVCRVAPQNVIQLLAREEGVYQRGRWQQTVDEEDTEELSGACETGMVRCANRPCEREIRPFPVALNDGGPTNGIFLVTVRNGDRPRDEDAWRNPRYNPNFYRLVCLSDLGLNVRQDKEDLGVWVTSLLSGRPVADVMIEVYSSANILVASGMTDANGWCRVKRLAKGEMFAVVAIRPEGRDMTFLALRDSMRTDETYPDGARPAYLEAAETDVFVWTERGIYRHGERLFVHAIARDGGLRAPKPMPLVLTLRSPKGNELASKAVMTDADGALSYEGFSVPAEQPSGKWKVLVRLPGKDGKVLAEREVKIEEFAPPQVRVAVSADEAQHPTNFTFRVSAEHLFGGPARSLLCDGAVVFEDVPFAPAGWKGYVFGNDQLGLKPCFRELTQRTLDARGESAFDAPLWADSGRPKAAVRATGQGIVFEIGGRPATARKSIVCHYYPYYIGSNLPEWLKRPETGLPTFDLVCVDPQGKPVTTGRKLIGKIERIDSVYSYKKNEDGLNSWNCERIRTTVLEQVEIPVGASGRVTYAFPVKACGDYVFTAEDPATGVSFGRTFYLSDWGDDVVRAPLGNPTEVTLQTDKAFYRVGDRPRLAVKAPFAGFALLTVLRQGMVYSEILHLTNATSEVVLHPVGRDWAPNVDVTVSVVQSVAANARHLAARAHGLTTVRVRPVENEIDVRLAAGVKIGGQDGGSRVTVDVSAPGATAAAVTLVDEGINLLTGEETPNPVSWLSRPRTGEHPLFDLFGRILPVADEGLKASGVKTGGGFGAEMLGRVSPVPTRRFKPLARWQSKVALKEGRGRAVFDLPEFVGEVRVTAVAYSATATGAASVQRKVTPKLVMQPDAPRFVAPGDAFEITLPLRNCSDQAGEAAYTVGFGETRTGRVYMGKGESTNVVVRLRAPKDPGEMTIGFSAVGFGERHATEIRLPVRPAVAWRSRTEVVRLEPGETLHRTGEGCSPRFAVTVGASPLAELSAALEALADYPHGCLEQTASRIFPLVTAGGILNSVASKAAADREEYVAAGVRRVESMVRENDFVMWPDCTYAPWDREVSLYAAHFLVEAERAGQKLKADAKTRVTGFLRKWALGTNDCESAYACHTLALAGCPEKDRMFRLYDGREKLDFLSRARLARAFAAIRDVKRAEALMAPAIEPQSVREAAFRVLALTDVNPDDPRLPALVAYLTERRDRRRFDWGTTADNAHALLAIGAHYRHHPVRDGEVRVGRLGKRDSTVVVGDTLALTNTGSATAFLTVRSQWLNDPQSETNEANGIFVSRQFLHPDGSPADVKDLVRGELLMVSLTLTSDVTRVVGDLVVEDLFAGAFEPVHREPEPGTVPASDREQVDDWVLRQDARDDRMLVFSKRFELKKDQEARAFYLVRVVTAGEFILPGPSVEGMYHPELRSSCAPSRIVVK